MGAIQVHEVYIASTDKNKREQEAKIETLRHKPSGNSRNWESHNRNHGNFLF